MRLLTILTTVVLSTVGCAKEGPAGPAGTTIVSNQEEDSAMFMASYPNLRLDALEHVFPVAGPTQVQISWGYVSGDCSGSIAVAVSPSDTGDYWINYHSALPVPSLGQVRSGTVDTTYVRRLRITNPTSVSPNTCVATFWLNGR